MKLNCEMTCKNEAKLRWEEKCVLISYNVYFCVQIPVCLKVFV